MTFRRNDIVAYLDRGQGGPGNRQACVRESAPQLVQMARLWLWLVALSLALPTGVAGNEIVSIEDVRVGIDGAYKLGQWTPVHVRIRTGAESFRGRVIVQVADPNGVAAQYVSTDFGFRENVVETITTYVKFGQIDGDLRVVVSTDEGRKALRRVPAQEIPRAVSTGHPLVMTIGNQLSLARVKTMQNTADLEPVIDRHITTLSDLPRHWLGYSSVDVLVLTSSNDEAQQQIDAQQWSALRRWVELGGTVIACGAARAEALFGPSGPLTWLVPGDLEGVVKQRQTTGIEQFAEATRRLDQVRSEGLVFELPMSVIAHPRGKVEATEGFGTQQSPAVIRGTVGLGRVVFVAFDLDQPPFTAWPDQPRLLAKLLSLALAQAGEEETVRSGLGPVAHVGFGDLIGQLRHALDQFSGVRLVPFSWIAALIAIYITIIGPLDYWLLRRWGRTEWTWLTFGLSVVAFTALAGFLAYLWKGHDFRCNQVTLIDVDLPSGTVRGTTWAHLFSPRTSQMALQTEPRAPLDWVSPPQQATSWQGLPGDGFGGLDRRDRTTTFEGPYQLSLELRAPDEANVRLARFPMAAWASQSLLGQWWGQVAWPTGSTQLTAGLDATLSGTITNPLPEDIDDAYLVYDRWAYRLGHVAPGATIQIDDAVGVDLQTRLTRRKVVDGRSVVTPWEHDGTDVDRIVQLLVFYEAAKGRAYTRLQHRYQRTVDWSDHVTAQQAVLWGTSRHAGADILLNGNAVSNRRDWTYYRLLIPVSLPPKGINRD